MTSFPALIPVTTPQNCQSYRRVVYHASPSVPLTPPLGEAILRQVRRRRAQNRAHEIRSLVVFCPDAVLGIIEGSLWSGAIDRTVEELNTDPMTWGFRVLLDRTISPGDTILGRSHDVIVVDAEAWSGGVGGEVAALRQALLYGSGPADLWLAGLRSLVLSDRSEDIPDLGLNDPDTTAAAAAAAREDELD